MSADMTPVESAPAGKRVPDERRNAMAASEPVLGLERVSVRYGRTRVLEDVSLSVARGSVFALLGRNGAGKSSLVRCILGQQRTAAGEARLFGKPAWGSRTEAMARVGVVPEEPDAPPGMSASQLAAMCRRFYPRWDDASFAGRLERNGVPRDRAFGKLSKGQKGAVMLALALAHGPELLVLDDPTLGLDAVARKELFDELIGELAERGTTVFVTSHDLEGIERLADRVAILKDRRLLLDEPLEDLKGRFRRIRLMGPAASGVDWGPFETLAATAREWGAEALVTNFSDEALAAFQARVGAADLEVASLSLEEIFVALVGRKEAAS
jgi:ABC-2 type transport system ATP-binding protein